MSTEGKKFQRKQFAFNGEWNPTDDPLLIGEENYSELENYRYRRRGGLEAVQGYSKINIHPIVLEWVAQSTPVDNTFRDICWSPELGLFCAIADTGTISTIVMTSPDGKTWTSQTAATTNAWRSICWSPYRSLFVAVAESGTDNRVMTSPDGEIWTSQSTAGANNDWQAVCWNSDLTLFVAVADSGSGNRVMTSPNGLAWTLRTSAADNAWTNICVGEVLGSTLLVAISWNGGTQQVMTSANGTSWAMQTTDLNREWYGICWSAEFSLFVIVGSGSGQLLTSPDGETWTPRDCPTNMFGDIAWSPERRVFAAVAQSGSSDRAMVSVDGINWYSSLEIADHGWWGVCWSPELSTFCAVSFSGSGNRAMTAYLPGIYNKGRSAIQLVSPHTQKTRVLAQAMNEAEDESAVIENLTDIPDQGDFEGDILQVDDPDAGVGRFSKWPGGSIAYCNGKEAKVYAGDEKECDSFMSATGAIVDDIPDAIDFSKPVKNLLVTPGNVAVLGGGVDSDTKLLLHCNGANGSTTIVDDGDTGHSPLVGGGAEIDTDYSKYGGASVKMTGATDYIYVPDHDDWYMAADLYTIDFFIRFNRQVNLESYGMFGQRVDGNNRVSFWQNMLGGIIKEFWLQYNDGGTLVNLGPFDATAKIMLYQWHHIALIRGWGEDSNKHAVTVDGGALPLRYGTADTTSDDWPQLAADLELGRTRPDGTTYYSRAWWDEIRVSKGRARWTQNFTPPAMAHGSGRRIFVLGSTRPLQGGKFYINAPNTVTSTLTVKEWNGAIWSELPIVDYTRKELGGGKSLAKTGKVTWPLTDATSKVKLLENQLLYWYQFELSAGDVEIYHVTLDAGWQDVRDIWDGLFRVVGRFKYKLGADELDGTLQVNIETPAGVAAADSYAVDLGGMLSTDWFDVGLEERTCALYIKMFEGESGQVNTVASVMTLEYWDSEGWVAASGFYDGTAVSGATLGKTGYITWDYPEKGQEAKRNEYGAKLSYYRIKISVTLSANVLVDIVQGIPAPMDPVPVYKFPFMFRSRPMLCGAIGEKEGSRVDFGITGSTEGFNGYDSSFGLNALYFGGSEDLSCACELYNRFGANIYHMGVFCKDNETYLLTGYNADNYTIRKISGSVGCPAPLTMDTVEMNYGMTEGVIRNVAAWLSYSGPYLFDAGVLEPITGSMKCYFDKTDSRCINFAAIERCSGWMDPDNLVYNLGLCSGAGQTEINVWICYDLILKRWFRKVPKGTDFEYPQAALRVIDVDGAQYVYGFRDNGYMMRLEDGAIWDGEDMEQKVTFADQIPTKNMWDYVTTRHFKLICESISEAVNITGKHYKDGEATGKDLRTIAANGANRYVRDTQKFEEKGWSHKFELEAITTTTVKGVPLLAWGYTFEITQEDL